MTKKTIHAIATTKAGVNVDNTHRKHSDCEANWYIAEEGEPRQISSPSVLVPRVRSRHFNASLAQAVLIVEISRGC